MKEGNRIMLITKEQTYFLVISTELRINLVSNQLKVAKPQKVNFIHFSNVKKLNESDFLYFFLKCDE